MKKHQGKLVFQQKARKEINVQQTSNSCSLFQDAYANPATCFLSIENKMIWSFAGPAVFIIGVSRYLIKFIERKTFHRGSTTHGNTWGGHKNAISKMKTVAWAASNGVTYKI